MTEASDKQMKALEPKDAKSLAEFRRVVGAGPAGDDRRGAAEAGSLEVRQGPKEVKLPDGVTMHLAALGRKGEGDMVPLAGRVQGQGVDAGAVVWVHPDGKASLFEKGKLLPAAKALVDKGYAVVAPDVFQTGELKGSWPPKQDPKKKAAA